MRLPAWTLLLSMVRRLLRCGHFCHLVIARFQRNVTACLLPSALLQVCAAGLWTDMSVHILGLPDLQTHTKDALGGEVVLRSLLYTTLGPEQYLLGGMGDGHLVIWRYDSALKRLSHRKKIALATQPGTY